MSIKRILGAGLSWALGTGIVSALMGDAVAAAEAVRCLSDHFTLSGRDLAEAFQDSLGRGASAIALGLSAEGAGVLTRLGRRARRAVSPNLARAYAATVERDYLLPYAATLGLTDSALAALRPRTLAMCRELTERRAELLPIEQLDESDLAGLVQGSYRDDLTALLLDRCDTTLSGLDAEVRGLLAHDGLLGDALLFFLRERLRADERVRATLEALQREGLWADLRDLKAAQQQLGAALGQALASRQGEATAALQRGDLSRVDELTPQLHALTTRQSQLPALLEQAGIAWQAGEGHLLQLAERFSAWGTLVEVGLDDLAGALGEVSRRLDAAVAAAQGAEAAARDAGARIDTGVATLQQDLSGLHGTLAAQSELLRALVEMLHGRGLGLRVAAGDELILHSADDLTLIRQVAAELQGLPRDQGYGLIQALLEQDSGQHPESAARVWERLTAFTPLAAAPRLQTDPGAAAKAPWGLELDIDRPSGPPHRSWPPVEDLHGWPAARVQALQQATAVALGRPVVFRDRLEGGGMGPELVVIPAGRFLMGSPAGEEGRSDNEQQHEVTFTRPFALGRYAITFDEYDAFCAATDRERPGDAGWGRGRRPVINVSWDDALAYCEWLSGQTGQNYRLPSEAEWEYACRAGTATPFHFGAILLPEQVNYNGAYGHRGQYRQRTVPVGSLPANPWSLHEMHGNLLEWCGDGYGANSGRSMLDTRGAATGDRRVLRGGAWFSDARYCRSAYRLPWAPDLRDDFAGFRLARGHIVGG